ncbi:hypothetical protein EGW08_007712, partial [Elysia chlorotica]
GAVTPYLRIYYDRPPDVVYKGSTLEARCTARDALYVEWLRLEKSYSALHVTTIEDNTRVRQSDDDPLYEITNQKYGASGEYEVSVLKIHRISTDLDDISLGCFTPKQPQSGPHQCSKLTDCVRSHPIQVVDGPRKPILTIPYDELPTYMFEGNTLLGQCDGHIGYGGSMVLVIIINGTVIDRS